MIIRRAALSDLPEITAIYADSVRTGTGSFELEPPDLAEMTRRHAENGLDRDSFLVADEDGAVVGYAYYGPYHRRPGYAWSAEISVYVRGDQRRKGVGRALVARLLENAERAGYRQMIAVIGDSQNAGSIGVHAAAGFAHAGTLKAVGYKLGGWRDVVLMQKALGEGAGAPIDPAVRPR